ncbi:calcium:proton antiporter [Asticcacaulis sp. ZE23SCel15]|uniref:calcium:proton antiporter n=1 Tax=Asticcacaulis sp. ZE23SCel15 TaxID=3059027 RepID=UPI00265E2121|nr:calcium:proton antiporter [Asticcacaulis sp. ZE23SCel15]WKL58319.1 calcium:proton antiporter [Asticcacaulis sp. ZE23SCel15]
MAVIRQERFLVAGLILALIALSVEHSLLAAGQTVAMITAAVLIGGIILVSLRVAHHAEVLAEKVGEPYGTMILTLSAVLVEVVILAIMLQHNASPTLARDTIYSAVMLDINGILGLAAILGGFRHGEQPYNVNSGNTYIVMILTAMGVSMIVPEFIPQASWHVYSIFSIGSMALLYMLFLRLQTHQHSYFFSYAYEDDPNHHKPQTGHARQSAITLVAGLVLIGFLAEIMSTFLSTGLEGSGLPPIIPALAVAVISASPEILTALRAALNNRMQSVVNIALGASLSTVILTVPVIETLALIQGHPFQMAMTPPQTVMTVLTLLVAGINLRDGETNAIEGATHIVLFAAFIMLAALGL